MRELVAFFNTLSTRIRPANAARGSHVYCLQVARVGPTAGPGGRRAREHNWRGKPMLQMPVVHAAVLGEERRAGDES